MRDSDFNDAVACWNWLLIAFVLCIALGSLFGCSRSNYTSFQSTLVDSLSVSNDMQYKRLERLINDFSKSNTSTKETYIKDSVVIVLNDVGEVVSREVVRIADKSISQQEIISSIQIKVDSMLDVRFQQIYNLIENEKQTVVPVEKELTSWQRIKQDYFGYLCGVAIALLLWIFRKPVIRLVRRFI